MSLRSRLLLALAYVLLLAIVALEVPLALNLRDRVDREVRSQALSAGRGRGGDVGRAARPRRRAAPDRDHGGAQRPRPRGDRRPGAVRCSPTPAGRTPSAPTTRAAPRSPRRCDGARSRSSAARDTLDAEILATAVPVLARGRPEGAVRVTQSVDAVNRATRASILGLIAIGGARAAARARGRRAHRAPDRGPAAPPRRGGARASPRATSPPARRSRAPRSSARSPPRSTR